MNKINNLNKILCIVINFFKKIPCIIKDNPIIFIISILIFIILIILILITYLYLYVPSKKVVDKTPNQISNIIASIDKLKKKINDAIVIGKKIFNLTEEQIIKIILKLKEIQDKFRNKGNNVQNNINNNEIYTYIQTTLGLSNDTIDFIKEQTKDKNIDIDPDKKDEYKENIKKYIDEQKLLLSPPPSLSSFPIG